MQLNTIQQTIQLGQTKLQSHLNLSGLEAKFEAHLLMQHALRADRAWLIAHENEMLQADASKIFQTLLSRRLDGEPIAYILGHREFYGLHLKVSSATLIPRPDTETLVDAALTKIPEQINHSQDLNKQLSVLDLGTGTGAVALAIAKNRPAAFVLAIDASQAALNIAIENAKNLAIHNVRFELSDWFKSVADYKFDFIVSNPPYIEENDEHLQQGDLRFEPHTALASGEDGLNDLRQIITHAPQHLNKNGWLMLEHGYNQAEAVAALFEQAGFSEISHVLDLSGIQRVTIGQFSL